MTVIWRISMVKLPQIIKQYKEGLLDPSATIELIQILLDTELLSEYPEFDKLADYYITEGLCYYVPVNIMPEIKD
tara:strand:- start:291 stop:515 length:225 start_codon:yes stop_codon:yes gene_type:complete